MYNGPEADPFVLGSDRIEMAGVPFACESFEKSNLAKSCNVIIRLHEGFGVGQVRLLSRLDFPFVPRQPSVRSMSLKLLMFSGMAKPR